MSAHAGLQRLLTRVEAVETELHAILEELPAAPPEDAGDESWRPRSLADYRRAMLQCILLDDVKPLRENLERVAGMTAKELRRVWR